MGNGPAKGQSSFGVFTISSQNLKEMLPKYLEIIFLGNDYGCSHGKCGRGFGPRQEKFYSCADIAITKAGPSLKKKGKKGSL